MPTEAEVQALINPNQSTSASWSTNRSFTLLMRYSIIASN
jgi:hypothetical protein